MKSAKTILALFAWLNFFALVWLMLFGVLPIGSSMFALTAFLAVAVAASV